MKNIILSVALTSLVFSVAINVYLVKNSTFIGGYSVEQRMAMDALAGSLK